MADRSAVTQPAACCTLHRRRRVSPGSPLAAVSGPGGSDATCAHTPAGVIPTISDRPAGTQWCCLQMAGRDGGEEWSRHKAGWTTGPHFF